jgi:hypothetical protein
MISVTTLLCATVLAAAPVTSPLETLPAAKPMKLIERLAAERPTVFVFTRPSSSLEVSFVRELTAKAGANVGFRQINVTTGSEPLVTQYEVKSTPTALVYDRRGRLVGRSSESGEILRMVSKAAQVMRIDWAEPGDPRMAETDKILGRPGVTGIMRTLSLQPEWLRKINTLHRIEHQPNTALDRRTKEMIATHVSALNRCKF